jgi:hypothetical protein
MACAFFWLAVAMSAGRVPADPASLMPGGTTFFLEVSDLSGLAAGLHEAPVLDKLRLRDPEALRAALKQLADAGVKTAAVGMDPSALGVRRWIAVGTTEDPGATEKLVGTWTARDLGSATIGSFLVIGDSAARIDEVREVAASKTESLAQQAGFRAFRKAVDGEAPIRFYCDVKQLWPRPFRTQIKNPSNVGWTFLGGHFTHVIRTVATVSGSMSLHGGLAATLSAEIRETDSRAFTEVNPKAEVIAMPAGFAGRLSVSRSLPRFWDRRASILPEEGRTALDSMAATVTSALPGWSVESLLGQFGDAFDVYFSATGAAGAPAVALVAVTAAERCELLAEFQRVLVALSSREKAAPAFRDEVVCHRGVSLHVARAPTSCEPVSQGPGPTFAVVKDRMIVGNRPSTVIALVDQLLDAHVATRPDGDELEVDGPRAAQLLKDAASIWSSQLTTTEKAESRAFGFFSALEGLLSGVRTARVGFDLAGKEASMRVAIDAPALFPADRADSRKN